MAQLAIYLDHQTARAIKKVSQETGLSRSEWVSRVVKKELGAKIPEVFFQTLGTWEDSRSPKQILKDIRSATRQKARTRLR